MRVLRIIETSPFLNSYIAVGLQNSVGSEDFANRLMSSFVHHVPSSHCTVFALQDNGRARTVSCAGHHAESASRTAQDYLRLGFDELDTNMRWLARRQIRGQRQLWCTSQQADEVRDERYRRLCYGENGLRERLSLLIVFENGDRVAVNFYRTHGLMPYSPEEQAELCRHGELLAVAVLRHTQLIPDGRSADHPPSLMARLSGRERQLITHILSGSTTREAAQAMGVAESTATTYRRRAYQHLGVRTHRELMALQASHQALHH